MIVAVFYLLMGACYTVYLLANRPARFASVLIFMGLWWPVIGIIHYYGQLDELLKEIESDA